MRQLQTLYPLFAFCVTFMISQADKDITIVYKIERTQTYDFITHVTSQEACTVLKNTEYHDNQCRCTRNHMFYVVDGKAGCFQAKQINPRKATLLFT